MPEPTRLRILNEPMAATSLGLSLVPMRRLRRAGLGPVVDDGLDTPRHPPIASALADSS
jgi:hypothetical protein